MASLDWQGDTDMVLDANKVRLALRHGELCSVGIVVEGLTLRAPSEGDRLRSLRMETAELEHSFSDADEFMESVIPGWQAHGKQLNRDVDSVVSDSARERDKKAKALMGADPRSELVEHWRRLGGVLPEPL